jgi:hypothetical protein
LKWEVKHDAARVASSLRAIQVWLAITQVINRLILTAYRLHGHDASHQDKQLDKFRIFMKIIRGKKNSGWPFQGELKPEPSY